GIEVGHEVHIALGDAGEPLDGGAIEPHAGVEAFGQFRLRARDALDDARDIGEPQVDELDTPVLDGLQDVIRRLPHEQSPFTRSIVLSELVNLTIPGYEGDVSAISYRLRQPLFVRVAQSRPLRLTPDRRPLCPGARAGDRSGGAEYRDPL